MRRPEQARRLLARTLDPTDAGDEEDREQQFCEMESHDTAFSRPDAVRTDAMSASRLHGPAPANEK